jgi:protein-S-isoprenylcysteine O-methyltransferase Ste14
MRPGTLFAIIWIGWLVSWISAALWSARVEKRRRAMDWDVWAYRLAILIGALLLWHSAPRLFHETFHETRLWHVGYVGAYTLAGLTLAGILFAWWARIYLGPLWSGTITLKQNHRVVDTGPYAWVRHPIYSGLIVALAATAAAQATVGGCAGAALIAIGFWLKARAEERFLCAELGAEAYSTYRRRVPMLVPFLPGG